MYSTFAWRYFRAKKNANAINVIAWVTVGVIAFATACQILVLSVFNGFEDLVKSLYSNFYPDIKLVPEKGKTFQLTPELIQQIKSGNTAAAISMVVEEKALIQNADQQVVVNLKGVDDQFAKVSGVPENTYRGSFMLGEPDQPGLVVGAGVQIASGITAGSNLPPSVVTVILPHKGKVSAANPMDALSEGDVVATGVFSIQQEFDNQYAITNIGFVKNLLNYSENEFSAAEVKLKPGVNVNDAQNAIQAIVGKSIRVLSKYQQNSSLYNTMKMEKWVIFAVLTLILLVAAFNMISALTMLVLEKQKDINVLQSLGATRKMVLKIFLSEGVLLGLIGTGIGLFMATVICLLQMKFKLIKLRGGSFLIDYFPVKMHVSDYVLVAGSALLIALLASWFPAKKAASQPLELK